MKILLLETVHDDAVKILEKAGEVELAGSVETEAVIGACRAAAAILTRGRGRIPEAAFAAGLDIRCVARCGVGTDNIDIAAATRRGIPVIYNPDASSSTVAEHAILLTLAVARRVNVLDRAVKENNWGIRETMPLGIELRGKILGVLGMGRIGRRVAELGHAFGMQVLYWSRHSEDARFARVEKEELFRQADILSIHVPLSPETRGLVDATALSGMKPTAILINTARGEVIHEPALVTALERGALAGAGLDVLAADSPRKDNPLWRFPNVVITPHMAGLTDRTYRRTCAEVAAQVVRVLEGKTPDPHFVRNPEVLNQKGKPG